ncbi:phasin family protein [Sphingomonas adhaesiva]|uniref:phasin family protein n=1 Tax=Sphingomonas adhaesiva TaxID=28212 RepID=UPI002FF7CFA5
MADDRKPIAPRPAGNGKAKAARAPRVAVTKPVAPSVVMPAPPPVAVVEQPIMPVPPMIPPAIDTPVAPPVASMPDIDTPPLAAKDETMNETVTNIADNFAGKAQDQARAMFAQANEQTRSTMEKGKKVAEDMAEFGKGNIEAVVESARIAAKGIETFGKDGAAFARARYESTAETVRAMASVKSPTELMQLQADYLRSAFDAVVAEASRSTEASLKLAGEIAAPLQNRLAIATDKIKAAA